MEETGYKQELEAEERDRGRRHVCENVEELVN